jgi:bifunctional DNA-binding transcriptional regulator/antitoxin component of YhaV-PrlF toxin-antitoxin module
MAMQMQVSPEGRLTLPARVQVRLGVENGGTLLREDVENGVLLRSVKQAIAQAQAIRRRYPSVSADASVDAFLASRTSESGL